MYYTFRAFLSFKFAVIIYETRNNPLNLQTRDSVFHRRGGREYFMALMRIAGKFESMSKRRRSAESGKFVDKATADANPDTTVTETISPTADLLKIAQDFVEHGSGDNWLDYRDRFWGVLARIEG
jgi:hypothetical protein